MRSDIIKQDGVVDWDKIGSFPDELMKINKLIVESERKISTLKSKEININEYKHLVVTKNLSVGVDDWTEAIKQAILDTPVNGTICFPDTIKYGTTETIVIDKDMKLTGGGILLSHHTGTCLLCKPLAKPYFSKLELHISAEKLNRDWNDNSIGIHVYNSYFGTFRFPRLNRFTTNFQLEGIKLLNQVTGSSYNDIYLSQVSNHRYGVVLRSRYNDGWSTENIFYNGSFGDGAGGLPEDNCQVVFDGDTGAWNNNNKFYNTSFEGFYSRVARFKGTGYNVFYTCRYEMPYMNKESFYADASADANRFIDGYGINTVLQYANDQGHYNTISAGDAYTGKIEYFNKIIYQYVPNGGSLTPSIARHGEKIIPLGGVPVNVPPITSGVLELDFNIGREFNVSVTQNITSISLKNFGGEHMGTEFTLKLTQDATGRNITMPTWLSLNGHLAPTNRPNGLNLYKIKSYSFGSCFVMSSFSK